MHLFNPAKLSEQLFIHLCALPEGYRSVYMFCIVTDVRVHIFHCDTVTCT